MGLTESAHYEDHAGRTISAGHDDSQPAGQRRWLRTHRDGAYFEDAVAVPLALNILGHDRPELGERRFPNDAQSYSPVVRSDSHRDELLADAVANLLAIDLYDQHLVKKKADDEAAAEAAKAEEALKAGAYAEIKAAQAKRDAERDKRIAAKEAARMELRDLARDAFAFGVTASRADTLAEAVTKYKAAVAAVGAPIF